MRGWASVLQLSMRSGWADRQMDSSRVHGTPYIHYLGSFEGSRFNDYVVWYRERQLRGRGNLMLGRPSISPCASPHPPGSRSKSATIREACQFETEPI